MSRQPEMSRRAALTGIALAGATSLVPIAGASMAKAGTADRAAWNRAFAAYERAKAEDAAFYRAYKELDARCEGEINKLPHITFGPDPFYGPEIITTESRFYVAAARRMVKDLAAGKRSHDPHPNLMAHEEFGRRVVAAADERDAKVKAIRDRFGMGAAEDKWERLSNATYDAQWALMAVPAPDGEALLWKLNILMGDDAVTWDSEKVVDPFMADARRLLSHGRA
ncbi:MAG TPA: hypothetical protein VEZ70_14425 [Allosphingosinicella sp.]|nr:hypothetical protein [Allosphingosinicella sp.]